MLFIYLNSEYLNYRGNQAGVLCKIKALYVRAMSTVRGCFSEAALFALHQQQKQVMTASATNDCSRCNATRRTFGPELNNQGLSTEIHAPR
jgi:hypothetical protein